LFDKSATSNWLVSWHQDATLPLSGRVDDPTWGPWTVKGGVLHANAPAHVLEKMVALRVHLDDSAESNGPLRVLPGTHAGGVLTHDAIQRAADSVRPVDCVGSAGGVVAMRLSSCMRPRSRPTSGLVACFTSNTPRPCTLLLVSSLPLVEGSLQPGNDCRAIPLA